MECFQQKVLGANGVIIIFGQTPKFIRSIFDRASFQIGGSYRKDYTTTTLPSSATSRRHSETTSVSLEEAATPTDLEITIN